MSNWIQAAEAALQKGPSADSHVDVLERYPPAVLDTAGLRGLLSPLLAAFLWSAAVFSETQAHTPFAPLPLLLRLLALALSLRALVLLSMLAGRLRILLTRAQYALVLTDDGLLFRSPSGDLVIPRNDVLEAKEHGDWRGKSGRRWAEVFVITRPQSGRVFVALPPVFERTPGVLAERLMRWLGPKAEETPTQEAPPAELASKLWERVAAGERPAGIAVIEHGRSWLRRGPYASVLLGVAMLDGYLRLPAASRAALPSTAPLAVLLALVIVPVAWLLYMRADLARQKGIALIFTPDELLLRTRGGVHRTRWKSLTGLAIETRRAWSILQGAYEARTIVWRGHNGEDVRYAEALLGAPAEVIVGLSDAYRKRAIASS